MGCRERIAGDDATSQSKAVWYANMDKELQSNFRKVRGLIFFNSNTGTSQNWTMNSSFSALQSLNSNIWADDYYFGPSTVTAAYIDNAENNPHRVFPNPSNGQIVLQTTTNLQGELIVKLYGIDGKCYKTTVIQTQESGSYLIDARELKEGSYLLKVEHFSGPQKSMILLRKKVHIIPF